MGEPALRCRACGGKFGPAGPAGTCELLLVLGKGHRAFKVSQVPRGTTGGGYLLGQGVLLQGP